MSAQPLPTQKPARLHGKRLALIACVGLLAACSESRVPFDVEFLASYGGKPIDCSSSPLALTDLRFYVSDIKVNGNEPMPLLRDERWQTRSLALVDLEDGSGACVNGSQATNASIRGTVPAGDLRGLTFTVGVPFADNHADPLLAEAPLNDAAMHWHWRSGYKFMRGGVQAPNDRFWIHLGSTACEGSVQNITHCDRPNRLLVTLPGYVAGNIIEIDFKALVAAGELTDGEGSDCSSGPAESACAAPFAALGLSHEPRQERGEQRVFKLRQ